MENEEVTKISAIEKIKALSDDATSLREEVALGIEQTRKDLDQITQAYDVLEDQSIKTWPDQTIRRKPHLLQKDTFEWRSTPTRLRKSFYTRSQSTARAIMTDREWRFSLRQKTLAANLQYTTKETAVQLKQLEPSIDSLKNRLDQIFNRLERARQLASLILSTPLTQINQSRQRSEVSGGAAQSYYGFSQLIKIRYARRMYRDAHRRLSKAPGWIPNNAIAVVEMEMLKLDFYEALRNKNLVNMMQIRKQAKAILMSISEPTSWMSDLVSEMESILNEH